MAGEAGRTRGGRSKGSGSSDGDVRTRRSGSKKREREILDAAADIFRRQGYADTSVQDVADAVGILKGSLYYYIESKEDLLFRVLSDVHRDAKGIIEEVAAIDAPALERLYEYIRRHVEYNSYNLEKIAVYYHDFGLLSEDRRRMIIRQRQMYERFVTNLIEEAQKEGDVHGSVDPKLAGYFILGGLNWVYTWYRPRGPVSPKDLGALYAELAIKGLQGADPENPVAFGKGRRRR